MRRALLLVVLTLSLLGQSQQPPPQAPAAAGRGRGPLRTVVLDPAHGGTDAGARGTSGVLEKDVVLGIARVLRSELERQGWHVVLTRQENENPSFDDRSALANAQRDAIFITLHVASTGTAGTARTYYSGEQKLAAVAPSAQEAPALLRWDQAQQPYTALSRRLAELVQLQLGQSFRGSPGVPEAGAVRQLRTVAAPAIAVELASVAVPERMTLGQMAPGLAEALARAVSAFRPVFEAGAP